MSDANVSILLADEKAHWMDSSHLGLLPDNSVVREWRNIPLQARTECIAQLKTRTTVTAPKADTKAYAGVWRVLKIEDIVERSRSGGTDSLTIRETLAKGYSATSTGEYVRLADDDTICGTGTTEAANIAHPGGTAPVQENWRKITIRWRNLNRDSLDAIMAERTTVYAATLTVGAESKTGPWYLIRRKPSWEEDGSGVYEETWSLDEWHLESKGKTGPTKDAVTRYIYSVPKDRVKTALDAEITALSATYGAQGYSYDQKIYWKEENADIITEVSKAIKIEIASFTAEKNEATVVSEKSGENLFDADIAAYDVGTVDQGHTIKVEKSRNADGTINATQKDELAVKQEIAVHNSRVTPFSRETKTKGKNLFTADITAYDLAYPQTAGTIEALEKVKNDDGTFNAVKTTEVAVEVADGGKTTNVAHDSVAVIDITRNVDEPGDLSTTPVAGKVKIQAKRLNDFSKWDVESTEDTRLDQSIAAPLSTLVAGNMSVTPKETSLTQVIDGQTAEPAPLGSAYGSLSYRKDKYGRYVGSRTISTYNDSFSIPGWKIGTDDPATYYVIKHIQSKGNWYKMTTPVTVTKSWHTSTAAAQAASVVNGDVFGPYKSGYFAIGPSQLVAIDVAVGAPTFELLTITTA